MSATERFARFVDKGPDCWVWTGTTDRNGYGGFHLDGRMQLAHRVAYRWHTGSIPEGFTIDHLCRNRSCVNPRHLEAVAHRVNVLRGEGIAAHNRAKTHCVRGHEFTAENTLPNTYGRGRRCLECKRIEGRERARRVRAEKVARAVALHPAGRAS